MAQDKSDKFLRPIPQRENEKLRANLSAPDILNPANPSFPVEGVVSSNRQPQKSTSSRKTNVCPLNPLTDSGI